MQDVSRQSTRGPLNEGDDPLAPQTQYKELHNSQPPSTSTNRPPHPQRTSSRRLDSPARYRTRPSHSRASSRAASPSKRASSPDKQTRPSQNSSEQERGLLHLCRLDNFHDLASIDRAGSDDVPHPQNANLPTDPTPDDLMSLLKRGHYHTASTLTAHILVHSPQVQSNPRLLLTLLHIRLTTLILLSRTPLAAQESRVLHDLNSSPAYRIPVSSSSQNDPKAATPNDDEHGAEVKPGQEYTEHLAPWSLRILVIRLHALAFGPEYWRRGIAPYYALAAEARSNIKAARGVDSREERGLWWCRLRELGVLVADALCEMGDWEGAVTHLRSLNVGKEGLRRGVEGMAGRWRVCMVLLRAGDVNAARKCFDDGAFSGGEKSATATVHEEILQSLILLADSQYENAASRLQILLDRDDQHTPQPEDVDIDAQKQQKLDTPTRTTIAQNLAVCHVLSGRIQEAQKLLTGLIPSGDDQAEQQEDEEDRSEGEEEIEGTLLKKIPEAVLFNLATIYELTSERHAMGRKVELAERVGRATADKGEGHGGRGWRERYAREEFKL
ncbi:MAG: hypothetical protein M1831_005556 [Alyxoria varia]|nr:MAG: hypothetical protein M1831_005556 [Alyxoria varia]